MHKVQMDNASEVLASIKSHVEKKDYERALEKIDEMDITGISDKHKIELLQQQCKLYAGLEEYKTSLEFGEAALEHAKQINHFSLILLSILALQVPLWYLEKWEELQTLIEQGLEVFEELNEDQQTQLLEKKGILLDTLALLSKEKGDFTQSLKLYESSLEIAKEVKDKIGEARTAIGIAVIHRNMGNYSESIKYSNDGILIAEKLENNLIKAQAMNNIGLVHQLTGNLDAALKYTYEVLKIQSEEGSQLHIAATYSNIGSILMDQRKIELALENQQKSLVIVQKIDSKFGALKLADEFSSIYMKIGRYDIALKFLDEALKVEEELRNKLTKSTLLVNRGIINCRMGYPEEGIKAFQKAQSYLENLGNPTLLAQLKINLGIAHKQTGNVEIAMDYYRKAFELANSIGHRVDIVISALYIALQYYAEGNKAELGYWYQKIAKIENPENIKLVNMVKTISKALFNPETNKEIRIKELKTLVEDEIIDYDLSILSVYHLSLLILSNFEENSFVANLTSLVKYVDKIAQFAEDTKSYVNLIDSYYLRAKLFSIQGEIEQAFDQLEYAIKISSDLGLQSQLYELEKEDQNLKLLVSNWKSEFDSSVPSEVKIIETKILEFLNNKTGSWGSLPHFDI